MAKKITEVIEDKVELVEKPVAKKEVVEEVKNSDQLEMEAYLASQK